jgi:DNA-binding transcriptional LysR family regulator
MEDLAKARWTLGPEDVPIARAVRSIFEENGIPGPAVAIEVDMIPLRRAIVMRSDMVSAFQVHHVSSEINEGSLVRIDFDLPHEPRPIGTIRIGPHTKTTKRFVDTLRKAYGSPGSVVS